MTPSDISADTFNIKDPKKIFVLIFTSYCISSLEFFGGGSISVSLELRREEILRRDVKTCQKTKVSQLNKCDD